MRNLNQKSIALFLIVAFFYEISTAQFIDTSADRVKTPLKVEMKSIGTIKPRSTKEIESSRLTVGCETLDRDHTVWDNYKDYLPPLGVKKIRLQAGWAKCERVPGVYDWKWLDEITYIPSFALSEYYWTEYTQAKYNMRRMLGDLGNDIETSVFTIIDIYYNWGDRAVLNTKGLM